MNRPKKKLTQADINRNSSIKISGTINKIKANERRYTISLVIIFMFIFAVVGYFTLKINIEEYDEYLKKGTLTLYSNTVVLDEEDALTDLEGLMRDDYSITLYNGIDKDIRYRVVLKKDDTLTNLCDCRDKEIKASDLRLSFNQDVVTFNSFDEIVIDTGEIKKMESKTIKVKVWLGEGVETHFHGRFILERIN